MNITCPLTKTDGELCGSEYLDQGINGVILCHGCGGYLLLEKQK